MVSLGLSNLNFSGKFSPVLSQLLAVGRSLPASTEALILTLVVVHLHEDDNGPGHKHW